MNFVEDSYEKALRIYGSNVEREIMDKMKQLIGKHTITTYKKKKKSKKIVVYKL
tara:strand:- start:1380 stop:1541 length:162 start_codon:yes stop_codon:yes gene_type:complete